MSKKNGFGDIEDGEIDFDPNFDYTPLERPVRNDLVAPRFFESDVEDKDRSSSSDSDTCDEANKAKIRKSDKHKKNKQQKPNDDKLKIWCHVLEDESVSNNLTDCYLDESQMRIRGLLPYARNIDYTSFKSDSATSNAGKRNHAGYFVTEKKYFRYDKSQHKNGASKYIPPLSDEHESDNSLATDIANKLNEVKLELIMRAIKIVGKEKIIPIFEETRKIELSGGMLVMNGSRRRTPGGTFFYLLKTSTDIPQEQLKDIFYLDKQDTSVRKKKSRQNKQPTSATVTNSADEGDADK